MFRGSSVFTPGTWTRNGVTLLGVLPGTTKKSPWSRLNKCDPLLPENVPNSDSNINSLRKPLVLSKETETFFCVFQWDMRLVCVCVFTFVFVYLLSMSFMFVRFTKVQNVHPFITLSKRITVTKIPSHCKLQYNYEYLGVPW